MGVIDIVLTLNGVTSTLIGVHVSPLPRRQKALRVQDTYTVPGKDGSVIIDSEYYPNVEQSYEFYVPIANEAAFSGWLNYSGYGKLVDSYYPNHYRMVAVSGYSAVEDRARNQMVVTVTFSCKPHWFRVDGDSAISFSKTAYVHLTNPGNSIALPLIVFRPAQARSYTIAGEYKPSGKNTYSGKSGEIVLTVPNDYIDKDIYIDCEHRSVYIPNSKSLNDIVTCNVDFPKLYPGACRLSLSYGATYGGGSVTPRWRDLL